MDYITGVLQTVFPVIFVIAIGMILRRKRFMSPEGIQALKNVAINIALPAVLLKAFATTSYSLRNLVIPLVIFGICWIAWLLGKLWKKLFHLQDTFLPYLTTGFEAGMLGYTLFSMLYGESHVASFAIVDLGQVLFVFTAYKVLIGREVAEKQSAAEIVRSMVTSPIILSIAAGVLIGASGCYKAMGTIGIQPIFDQTVDFIAAPTSVLILIAIGYDLVLKEVPLKKVFCAVAARIVIMGILLAAVSIVFRRIFPQEEMLIPALTVMFILPPPYVLPVFTEEESQRTYISSTLTIYTMLSIAAFAVLAAI